MSTFIFTERGLCFLHQGKLQWVSLEEAARLEGSQEQRVAVLLGGVEYRTITSTVSEHKTGECFPNGFMTRSERIKGGVSLEMGVREELLARLYNFFPRGAVKTCVPYGIAVRSFLLSQGWSLDGMLYLVVDHAGERVFITIIEEGAVLETRELIYQDEMRLAEEVKRSEKRCLEKATSGTILRIVSNHRTYLDIVRKSQPSREVIFIDEVAPVLGVMEKARFGIHFSSPSENASRQSQEIWWHELMRYSVGIGLCGVSIMSALIVSDMGHKADVQTLGLRETLSRNEASFKARVHQTYQDHLMSLKRISMEKSFVDLAGSFTSQWYLQRLVWTAGMDQRSAVEAVVITGSELKFTGCGIFKGCTMTYEIIGGQPAVRLVKESI